MIKKTYKTFSLKRLTLRLVCGNGERVDITFRGGVHVDSTAKFSTSNPDIQEMLESCSGFGRDYYIESTKEIEDAAPAETVEKKETQTPKPQKVLIEDLKDIKRFRNLVEMRNYIKGLGIELADDANYLQAKAAAAKEGYDFQIQK